MYVLKKELLHEITSEKKYAMGVRKCKNVFAFYLAKKDQPPTHSPISIPTRNQPPTLFSHNTSANCSTSMDGQRQLGINMATKVCRQLQAILAVG